MAGRLRVTTQKLQLLRRLQTKHRRLAGEQQVGVPNIGRTGLLSRRRKGEGVRPKPLCHPSPDGQMMTPDEDSSGTLSPHDSLDHNLVHADDFFGASFAH
jgi:hypothetical protein